MRQEIKIKKLQVTELYDNRLSIELDCKFP